MPRPTLCHVPRRLTTHPSATLPQRLLERQGERPEAAAREAEATTRACEERGWIAFRDLFCDELALLRAALLVDVQLARVPTIRARGVP